MLEIDNTLLFLNLSHKGQIIWKRFEEFQKKRQTYLDGTLIGFYPSRDLYSDSTWSVYELRLVNNTKGQYISLIWDYCKPLQRGTPTDALDYFEMRPEFTGQSYKPLHYYKTEHMLQASIKRLHPKMSQYINKGKINKD
jgi:hypothetical protein